MNLRHSEHHFRLGGCKGRVYVDLSVWFCGITMYHAEVQSASCDSMTGGHCWLLLFLHQ